MNLNFTNMSEEDISRLYATFANHGIRDKATDNFLARSHGEALAHACEEEGTTAIEYMNGFNVAHLLGFDELKSNAGFLEIGRRHRTYYQLKKMGYPILRQCHNGKQIFNHLVKAGKSETYKCNDKQRMRNTKNLMRNCQFKKLTDESPYRPIFDEANTHLCVFIDRHVDDFCFNRHNQLLVAFSKLGAGMGFIDPIHGKAQSDNNIMETVFYKTHIYKALMAMDYMEPMSDEELAAREASSETVIADKQLDFNLTGIDSSSSKRTIH